MDDTAAKAMEYFKEMQRLRAEIERLRDALDVIAGFGKVPLASEWEAGLRGIIRAMTDCANNALCHQQLSQEKP